MFRYAFLGLQIDSTLSFPFLEAGEAKKPADVCFVELESTDNDFLQDFQDKKKPLDLSKEVSYLENSYLYMRISYGQEISFLRKEKCSDIYARAFLIGFGMSLIAHERDMLAIHGSVVVRDNKAYLISGESGSGKSTLTNELLKQGYQFMADDMTFVNAMKADKTAFVYSAFPYQKLCRDAAIRAGLSLEDLIYVNEEKDKFLAPCQAGFVSGEMPLAGLIYLTITNKDQVGVINTCGLDSFHVCTHNLFLRHLIKDDLYMAEIGQKCLKMASKIRVCVIERPVNGNTLEEITQYAVSFMKQ